MAKLHANIEREEKNSITPTMLLDGNSALERWKKEDWIGCTTERKKTNRDKNKNEWNIVHVIRQHCVSVRRNEYVDKCIEKKNELLSY